MQGLIKEKIRKFCSTFWKKIYIYAPIIVIVFFTLGFANEFFYANNLQKEIKNNPSSYAEEFIDIMNKTYDDFSNNRILEYAFGSGIAWGILYSILLVYVILLMTLFLSKKEYCKVIGWILLIITILIVLGLIVFVKNFSISF